LAVVKLSRARLRFALVLSLAFLPVAFGQDLGAVSHAEPAKLADVPVGELFFLGCPAEDHPDHRAMCAHTDPIDTVVYPSLAPEIMILTPNEEPQRFTENDVREIAAAWISDESRIAVSGERGPAGAGCRLYLAEAASGSMTPIIEDDDGVCWYATGWSPNENRILLTAEWYMGGNDVFSVRPDGTAHKLLFRHGRDAQWISNNRLVFLRTSRFGGGIHSTRADGTRSKLLVAEPERPYLYQLTVSPDRRKIAYVDHGRSGKNRGEVYVMRADGTNRRRLTRNHRYELGVTWSPDDARLAFFKGDYDEEGFHPYTVNIRSGKVQKLRSPGGVEVTPYELVWSSDGKHVAYEATSGLETAIFTSSSNGDEVIRHTGFSEAIELLGWR
jgi:Tol biopolymer transport system component